MGPYESGQVLHSAGFRGNFASWTCWPTAAPPDNANSPSSLREAAQTEVDGDR